MENLEHFVLSNRAIDKRFKPDRWTIDTNTDTKEPLRYTAFTFEPRYYTEESWIPNEVKETGQGFIDEIVAATANLPEYCRNVTIYIHGFHHMTKLSYKLDIMKEMVDAYCRNDENRVVGKFVFFSWPATQTRSNLADRAYEMGQNMFTGEHARFFENLYDALNKNNIQLHLMSHSFGHHVLNGFLAAYTSSGSKKQLFNRVFLFAPDVPHGALSKKGGVMHTGKNRLFDLNPLEKIAHTIHCYHCRYDRMLMASTAEHISGKQDRDSERIKMYLCLGSVGDKYAGDFKRDHVKFHDVLNDPIYLEREQRFDRSLGDKKIRGQMDWILNQLSFEKSNQRLFAVFSIVRDPWVDLHRCSIYSNSVQAHVRDCYRQGKVSDKPLLA